MRKIAGLVAVGFTHSAILSRYSYTWKNYRGGHRVRWRPFALSLPAENKPVNQFTIPALKKGANFSHSPTGAGLCKGRKF